MELIKAKDYTELSETATKLVCQVILEKPESVLGWATGSTPLGLYERLVSEHHSGKINLSNIYGVNLDEYVGLSSEHKMSYWHYMWYNLYSQIDIGINHIHIPNGLAEDLDKECRLYDETIRKLKGIDLQALGIGVNGHIGFNEPADVFIKDTHVVQLNENTRCINSRFFDSLEQVPTSAVTLGVGAIMEARRILLLVSGSDKAVALKKTMNSDITPQVPATILQLHPSVTVIADTDACAYL